VQHSRTWILGTFVLLLIGGVVSPSHTLVAQVAPSLIVGTADAARVVAAEDAMARHLEYLPGQVLVKFKDGTNNVQRQSALHVLRSRPALSDMEWIGDVALLRDPTDVDARFLATLLAAQPEVEYAEPNYLRHLHAAPNDPSFSRQWNFSALDVPRAWDINPGATSDQIVAVLDTGLTTANQTFSLKTWNGHAFQTVAVPFAINPDLAASRLVTPRDFATTAAFGVPFAAVVDMVGHSTHVSSTIGEDTNNGLAEAGIAYKTRVMPVKVCVGYWEVQFVLASVGVPGFAPANIGGCPESAIVQGIRYAADNGAKVINLSLGGSTPSSSEHDALAYAVGKGVFIAISAGNGYEDGNAAEYPAAYAPEMDGVMSVAAVGRSLNHAFYSTTGPQVEIAAPGGDPRDGGSSGEIWQATILPTDSNPETTIFPRFDRYAEVAESGTSMAAPHVSGVAALLISQGVTKPAAVEALIKATARDLGSPGRDDQFGYGLLQPRVALRGLGVK
jgi:serine protease